MCDTFAVAAGGRTVFAKASDRPHREAQIPRWVGPRPPGGRLRVTHITIPDAGAHPCVGSRPVWMWGFEHGVNAAGVAVGNEKVDTPVDHRRAPALTGMDIVRLALERATDAAGAVDVIGELTETVGQGGVCDRDHGETYDSSYLVADPSEVWIVETAGRDWVARRTDRAAISNRLTLTDDWDRASPGVPAGTDVQTWRDPGADLRHVEPRLEVTRRAVTGDLDPAGAVAVLRHHRRPWGAPGRRTGPADPPARVVSPCMHLRPFGWATTAAMVAELTGAGPRVWLCVGNPCVGVFVPVEPTRAVPWMTEARWWPRFSRLAEAVEADPGRIEAVRERLDPLEDALWDGSLPVADAAGPLDEALSALGV